MVATRPRISLTTLAWANVALHVVGLAFAALGMRPGTPLVSLRDRLDYLAGSPLGWTLGWACWMACTVLLIAFLAALTQRLGSTDLVIQLVLPLAIAGAAFDIFCDAVYIVVLPMIASWQPPPEQLFLTIERLTGLGSMIVANGAYSMAILLLSTQLPGRASALVGYAVAGFGFLLAAAGFTGVPWHAEWATPPTIGLFCVWVVLVANSRANV